MGTGGGKTLIGTAEIAQFHPHISGGGFDLPAVGPVFEAYVSKRGLSQRLRRRRE
jgi:hypothetical protein